MGLQQVAPNEAGLDAGRLARVAPILDAGVEHGVYTAAVLCVVREGKVAWLSAHGTIGEGVPTAADTIFDLASVTKPHTALGLLRLVEMGEVLLSQTVGEFFPEARPGLARVTLRQLATHVSGLIPWKPLYEAGAGKDAMLREILSPPLERTPGERYAYSDLGYILLGEVIERVSGVSLAEFLRREVFEPLGMADAGFLPDPSLRPRIAPCANCPAREGQTLVGEVHDANAHFYGGVAGHAGLFGTAPDLATVVAMMLSREGRAGDSVLSRPALDLAEHSCVPEAVGGHTIGWFASPNPMLPRGDLLSDKAFGHTGYTGTMVVCDPMFGVGIVLLTNRVINPADNTGIQSVRRRVINVVAGAICGG